MCLQEDIKEAITVKDDLRELIKNYSDHVSVLENMWDGIPAIMFFKDRNNVIVKANKMCAEAMGMEKSEIEGKPFDTFGWNEEIVDKYFRNDIEIIRSRKNKLNIIEYLGNGKDLYRTDKFPIISSEGEVIGILGISVKL